VRTSTETLIAAMHILATQIQSDDGVANAVIAEAAQRLEEQQERIKRLEEAGDEMHRWCSNPRIVGGDTEAADEWREAKEAKP